MTQSDYRLTNQWRFGRRSVTLDPLGLRRHGGGRAEFGGGKPPPAAAPAPAPASAAPPAGRRVSPGDGAAGGRPRGPWRREGAPAAAEGPVGRRSLVRVNGARAAPGLRERGRPLARCFRGGEGRWCSAGPLRLPPGCCCRFSRHLTWLLFLRPVPSLIQEGPQ